MAKTYIVSTSREAFMRFIHVGTISGQFICYIFYIPSNTCVLVPERNEHCARLAACTHSVL